MEAIKLRGPVLVELKEENSCKQVSSHYHHHHLLFVFVTSHLQQASSQIAEAV
jgi:hypothetical protein